MNIIIIIIYLYRVTYGDNSYRSTPCFKVWKKFCVMIMDFVEADNGLYFWDMDAVEPNGRNKPPAKT